MKPRAALFTGRTPSLVNRKTRLTKLSSIVNGRRTPGNQPPRASPHIRSMTVGNLAERTPIARVLRSSRAAGHARHSSLSYDGDYGLRSSVSSGPNSWTQNQNHNTPKSLGSSGNVWRSSLHSSSSATGSPPASLSRSRLYSPISYFTM